MTPNRLIRTDDIPVIARAIVDALPLASARLSDYTLYDRVQAILLLRSRPVAGDVPCAVCNRTAGEMLSDGHCLPCKLEQIIWDVHAKSPNNITVQAMIDEVFRRHSA